MNRIMIVDDALFMRQMISRILQAEGYEICAQATCATEAVEKFKEYKPSLVTMDIVMPMMEELDGIGAVRKILEIDPQAKIVICSVMGQQSMVVDAIRAGARDFVTKPIQPERLIGVVKKLLNSA
jgi:two-component system, chemotaxis family, chemotaxis protein CheY